MILRIRLVAASFLASTAALLPAPALAYTGPTLGLGIVGSVLAILAVLVLSLFAFVVQPLRRRWRRSRGNAGPAETGNREPTDDANTDDGH